MALDLEETEKACAAVRCSRHRRTVNSFAHLSFERPRSARGDGGSVVFDRIGGQTVRPRACDAACRADPVCRYATKLAQQRWHDACTTMAITPVHQIALYGSSTVVADLPRMLGWSPVSLPERQRLSAVLRAGTDVVRDRLLRASFRTAAPECVLDWPRSVETRSSARSWVGVFGNGALRARIVVSTSSILN